MSANAGALIEATAPMKALEFRLFLGVVFTPETPDRVDPLNLIRLMPA